MMIGAPIQCQCGYAAHEEIARLRQRVRALETELQRERQRNLENGRNAHASERNGSVVQEQAPESPAPELFQVGDVVRVVPSSDSEKDQFEIVPPTWELFMGREGQVRGTVSSPTEGKMDLLIYFGETFKSDVPIEPGHLALVHRTPKAARVEDDDEEENFEATAKRVEDAEDEDEVAEAEGSDVDSDEVLFVDEEDVDEEDGARHRIESRRSTCPEVPQVTSALTSRTSRRTKRAPRELPRGSVFPDGGLQSGNFLPNKTSELVRIFFTHLLESLMKSDIDSQEAPVGASSVSTSSSSASSSSSQSANIRVKKSQQKSKKRSRDGGIQILFDGRWYRGSVVRVVPSGHRVQFDFDGSFSLIPAEDVAAHIRPYKGGKSRKIGTGAHHDDECDDGTDGGTKAIAGDCPICLCPIESNERVKLKSCGHCFCRPCFDTITQFSAQESADKGSRPTRSGVGLSCPLCRRETRSSWVSLAGDAAARPHCPLPGRFAGDFVFS